MTFKNNGNNMPQSNETIAEEHNPGESVTYEIDLSQFNPGNSTFRSNHKSLMVPNLNQGKKSKKKKTMTSRNFLSQKKLEKVYRANGIKPKKQSNRVELDASRSASKDPSILRKHKNSKRGQEIVTTAIPKLAKIFYIDKLIEAISMKDPENPFMEHFSQSTQSIVYIKSISKPKEHDLVDKKVYLPPQKENKKTLILDLDETLIHCNKDPNSPCDKRIKVKFPSGEKVSIGVTIRPFARKCLKDLSKYYEIVMFTASLPCYANTVINLLDPENKFISARFFRDHCFETQEGIYIKDLRIFANRDLKDLIIADSAVYSYGFNIDNGVPLLPFFGDKKDGELLELCDFLVKVKGVRDLRKVVQRYFMTSLFEKYAAKAKILKQKILLQRNKLY